MASRNFLGAGDLYLARYDDATGTWGSYDGPFETNKFEIKPNSELKESTSKGRETYGNIVESVPLNKPVELSVELAEINKTTLAMALFGTNTTLSQGSATLTDVAVTAKKGYWIELGYLNLATAGFTVKNSAGSTTYVLGTDYEVNYRLGQLRILTGSAIADGASLKVSGTANAVSGTIVAGGIKPQVRVKAKLDGKNLADNLPAIVEVYEAILTPDAAFDFLSNDFGKVSLKGKLKIPSGKTEPFRVLNPDAVI